MDKIIGAFILVLFAIVFSALIYGTIIYFLWNWLMPIIFGLPTITWVQGYGLSVLFCCLFPKTTVNNNK